MLSLEEIGQSVRNNLQLIIDSSGLDLAVGPISDQDYRILCGGFGDLDWNYAICTHGNDPDRFEFCVKLVTDHIDSVPAGIALCVFGSNDKIFQIHMIESFVRDDEDHPLKGRMVTLTLMAAYIFCMAVEATEVYIVEPDQDLIDYYSTYGFSMHECGYIMKSDVAGLETTFKKFYESIQ
ncbi:hypothetical protein B4923_16375 [Brenneria roseae subsp. americana]|uniref:N-acetyltransferase n=1 Tax=Brenneria roseae subsp. americana TaxID=1508507 RepID=A0A2U1TMR7_9GAMM|nr:hypothetical protein [Brenneria roseae]PWC10691.1 hypothetical protein B4923_16375 [Brenneria roseae subsp. americana]